MASLTKTLSREIERLKQELYVQLDSKGKLNNSDVYILSVKLDSLIYKYQCIIAEKAF